MKSLNVDKLLITHQLFNLSTFKQKQAKLAFTMAEILLSLTIIGVVAAITLPSLTGNINERTWNTQRQALYSRFSQAISLMPALNNYGVPATNDPNNVAEVFITNGLSKVLKINNICSYNQLEECGIPTQMSDIVGNKLTAVPSSLGALNPKLVSMEREGYGTTVAASYSQYDLHAAAFETQNGESVIAYYNPTCKISSPDIESGSHITMQQYLCVNFIYDLNGKKGPNTVGKDIGVISAFNATDSVVVAPNPYKKPVSAKDSNAATICSTELNSDEYRLPNYLEATSLWANRILFNYANDKNIYTQTMKIKSDGVHRRFITANGELMSADLDTEYDSLCIKR